MQKTTNYTERIKELYNANINSPIIDIEQLPISGSDRLYFRINSENQKTVIATYSEDKSETNSFLYFSRVFKKHQLPVPEIIAVSGDKKFYLQEDLGSESLLDILLVEGHTNRVKDLYKKAIENLAKFHWQAGREIDYTLCHGTSSFNRKAILSDLLYFKYYFADILKIDYDKNALLEEIEEGAKGIASQKPQTFMYRDFQSRNIMVQNDEVYFIDYQGGMQGLPQYDIASLLWQAKAQLPEDWKNELLNHYFTAIGNLHEKPNFDESTFRRNYLDCVILRILQTLGAYGYRGLIEQKPHFLTSIHPALLQLKTFITTWPHLPSSNELRKLLFQITKPEIIERFHPKTFDETAVQSLVINLYSFSYKKGLPEKENDHGGGFVFDCRGILNPGRFDEYKQLTGIDAPVKEFLATQTEMPLFLDNIFKTVDISIDKYLERSFDSLSIAFGCTGGQHRSVFAAEQMKKHIKEKYNIDANLVHLEQEPNDNKRR